MEISTKELMKMIDDAFDKQFFILSERIGEILQRDESDHKKLLAIASIFEK